MSARAWLAPDAEGADDETEDEAGALGHGPPDSSFRRYAPLGSSQRPPAHVLRITTTARSSERSPPANSRASSATATASARADRSCRCREQRVEPLVAVELAVPPRLDDAVGVEDERRARAAARRRTPRTPGRRRSRARGRAPRAVASIRRRGRSAARDGPALAPATCPLTAVDDDVAHADELAGADLAADHVVRGGEEVGRLRVLARERAEDELRHRHVGGRVDAVPRHVAEHDGEPAVVEREEVVEVAADVDARRRLVHLAHLEPLDDGPRARQQRALHRVGELLLLLVEARVVDREGRLRRERRRGLDRLLRERVARAEREDAERGDHLGRQRDGNDGRRPALLEERDERRQELLAASAAGAEPEGCAARGRAAARSADRTEPAGSRIVRDRARRTARRGRGSRAARAARAARRASARRPRRGRAPRRRCARARRASRRAGGSARRSATPRRARGSGVRPRARRRAPPRAPRRAGSPARGAARSGRRPRAVRRARPAAPSRARRPRAGPPDTPRAARRRRRAP